MVITICVGSACHLKGSQKVIETLQRLVAEKNLDKKVELKAGFISWIYYKKAVLK